MIGHKKCHGTMVSSLLARITGSKLPNISTIITKSSHLATPRETLTLKSLQYPGKPRSQTKREETMDGVSSVNTGKVIELTKRIWRDTLELEK